MKLYIPAILTLYCCLSIGCGGGSSTSASSAPTGASTAANITATLEPTPTPTSAVKTPSYTPSQERLTGEATDSTELYIEESFNFDSTKTLVLRITGTDLSGSPAAHTRIKVKQVDALVSSWDNPQLSEAALLTTGTTNDSGEFIRTLEVAGDVEKLLLEISLLGVENRALVALTNSSPQPITYHFQ